MATEITVFQNTVGEVYNPVHAFSIETDDHREALLRAWVIFFQVHVEGERDKFDFEYFGDDAAEVYVRGNQRNIAERYRLIAK